MQGTPWYQVLSNPNYSSAFQYIGAFVEGRERLIDDGWADQSYTCPRRRKRMFSETCRRIRYEQSDMVMILLNLSYIPDDVIRHIDFEPGWQRRFHGAMRGYKEFFQQQMRRPWKY